MVEDVLTKEELSKMEKDIAEARSQLTAKASELEQAKEVGRKEAEKDIRLQQELEAQKRAKAELEQKLAEQKKSQEEQAKKFQEQLDALKTTKLPVQTENPFAQQAPVGGIKHLTREQLDGIEEASRDLFFKERGPGSR